VRSAFSLRSLLALAIVSAILVGCLGGPEPSRRTQTRALPLPEPPSESASAGVTSTVLPLRGVPMGRTGLRLLVADAPAPFVLDVDRGTVQPITGLPKRGERGVGAQRLGEQALLSSYRLCAVCRPRPPGVYLLRRGSTAATRLGVDGQVVPSADGEGLWTLRRQRARHCTVRKLGLDGHLRTPVRPVRCGTELVAELPAGLLVNFTGPKGTGAYSALLQSKGELNRLRDPQVQPVVGDLLLTGLDRRTPLLLHDVRSGSSRRLRWPSRRGYSLGEVTGDPSGRFAIVEFAKFSPEHKLDLWLLDTVTRRWRHLPGMPARIVPKATDVEWTADGRVVILAVDVLAVWRPSESRLAVRLVRAARQPGSEFVVW
jgi:hypothetical protein